jgi:hypothetical protein
MSSADELLRRTIERANYLKTVQKNAYSLYKQQVAEQIAFLQQCGVTKIHITIPEYMNRVPMCRPKVLKKLRRELTDIGYSVQHLNDFDLIISWFNV